MSALDKLITSFSNQHLKDFFFNKVHSFEPETDVFDNLLEEESDFENPEKIGQLELEDNNELLVFTCVYKGELTQRSAKKRQFEIAKKVLSEDFKDGAIFVFYDENGNFRFSFIRRYYGEEQKYSNWKRFTYYVQPNKQNKTFKKQLETCSFSSLDEIEAAFNVEALSKEFYTELSHWYFASLNEVEFPNEFNENERKLNSQAMIRLITRMMFVWFMKQKGLIPNEIFEKDFLDNVLKREDKTGSTYYKAILQNLFFATLNTEMGEKRKWVTTSAYGVQHFYRYQRFFTDEGAERFINLMQDIPFLNGGLFENLDIVETADKERNLPKKDIRIDCFSDNPKNEERLKVPDYLFFGTREADISSFLDDQKKTKVKIEGLIDLLNRYDFTIDENSPDDQEVALDPELLGTVFENLLASYNPETQSTARKESGSFYTPRPIVDYMVKESLFYYLQDKSKIEEEKLKLLLEAHETEQLNEKERRTLVQHLTHIKILDPACGSGAFPMGVLQQMVRILNLLDPENIIYKEELQEKLKQELQFTIDKSNFEELKTNIEEVFANQYNDPDYARKLFLIQNCLYGVDIQSIAMQITKLRFFISLLVEQQIDKNQENFGVKPLPNLETKFVAANTLIGLDKQDGELKNLFIQEKEEELAEVREKYFSARTFETKRKYRAKDLELREEIAKLLIDGGFAEASAKQISSWDPFDQNASSSWFDPEWMFGTESFDLVIGNPPYIQLQKALPNGESLKYADLYKNEGYKTFERTGDIYALFYEQGLNLANSGGLLCYITSNKWMRAKYGESLRKYFSSKEPLKLLDLGPGIFEAATVDTNILIVRDRKVKEHDLKAFTIQDKKQVEMLSELEMTTMKNLSEDSWIILSPIEQSIKEKIERIGTPLKDWDIKINRGILTGFNKAFIIDGEKRKELIEQDSKSDEIIKPLLRGRDIKRYKAEFADLWLINTHNGYKTKEGEKVERIKIEDYPAVKRHLDEHWERLEKRSDQGDTPYNLRSCAYLEEFEKEKIIWKALSLKNDFCFISKTIFNNDKANILTSNNESVNLFYLLSYFNSSLFLWQFSHIGINMGRGFEFKIQYIEKTFIYIPSESEIRQLEEIVDQILLKKENDEDTTAEEREIDVMVYKLYELTYDEVKIVDPEFWMSEEEYENFKV